MDETAAALGVTLREDVARAVPKRRAEYVAGRHCAVEALRTVLAGFVGDIPTDSDRVTCWPRGVIGSITHTHGFASAAVALLTHARGIGLDSERVLTQSAMRAVRRIGARADDTLPASLGLADEVYYALLFSAKESVFKCLYPQVRRMFGFQEVRVTFTRGLGVFQATMLVDLNDEVRVGFTIGGRWVVAEPLVHTGAVLETS